MTLMDPISALSLPSGSGSYTEGVSVVAGTGAVVLAKGELGHGA